MVEQERGGPRFLAAFCWNEQKEAKRSRLAPGAVFVDEFGKRTALPFRPRKTYHLKTGLCHRPILFSEKGVGSANGEAFQRVMKTIDSREKGRQAR
jgi:hypothetical protein